jgi:predicted NAD/FAD-binding protein
MVADILRFFRTAEADVATVGDDVTIGAFLQRFGYSEPFIEDHILPMTAAIWSTPARSMLDFPARTLIAFLANHGLLQINNRPRWRTVVGGSRRYVDRLIADGGFRLRTGLRVERVMRRRGSPELTFAGGASQCYDQVIFACRADQALALLGDPSRTEEETLSAFRSTVNKAVLHTDAGFMPRRKRLWSAWNYRRTGRGNDASLSLTYWMNQLQPLPTATQLFVTLNPMHDFAPGTVLHTVDYEHPLFDAAAIAAQREISRIQGTRHTWFAGAWLGYGFHEDGLQSGLEIAERIGPVLRPWSVENPRGRIEHNWVEEEAPRWAAE